MPSTMTTLVPKLALLLVVASASVSAFVGQSSRSLTNSHNINARSPSTSARSMAATSTGAAVASTMLPEGLVKTVVRQPNNPTPIGRGDVVTVKYTCYSMGSDNDDDNGVLLARSDSQKMVVGDGSMVPGWDAALRTMAAGERSVVRIVDNTLGFDGRANRALEALGCDSATRQLEFDIDVLAVQTAARAAELFDMNFDAMALEDNTPKTAAEIAEAYQVRMANKAPEKEGLEGWIDKVKNYYFFGFFEGETGEEAPWYLKPSITFPIAFAVVGAAFYVSILSGAISEKGAQSIDELDVKVVQQAVQQTSGWIQSTAQPPAPPLP